MKTWGCFNIQKPNFTQGEMIQLKPGRYYRIMYSNGSHKNFQAINVPLAKHLITVKIEDGSICSLVDILSESWIDIFGL
jgi:hypothetical protein